MPTGRDLPLTHEFLSIMLGVRRAGVTTALQVLEETGAVTLRRSTVTVRTCISLFEAAVPPTACQKPNTPG